MMTAADVLELIDALANAGIEVWLDGGWGVDALVGEQTRSHDDLDLVLALLDVPAAVTALAPLGFVVSEDELPTRLVVRDPVDRRIDVHAVTWDDEGGAVQLLQDGTPWRYPPGGLDAAGVVGGRAVRCLTAETQVLCHTGYEPDEQDRHDLNLLAGLGGTIAPAPNPTDQQRYSKPLSPQPHGP